MTIAHFFIIQIFAFKTTFEYIQLLKLNIYKNK